MRLRAPRLNTEGQSTLEFTLTLILAFALVSFYFRLTTVFAFGNFVHYAVYMTARAYLAAGPSEAEQRQRAEGVAEDIFLGVSGAQKYKRFGEGVASIGASSVPGLVVGAASYFAPNRLDGWSRGATYTFKSQLFMIPLVPSRAGANRGLASGGANNQEIELTAESFLGREPSTDECVRVLGSMGKPGKATALYDNGC